MKISPMILKALAFFYQLGLMMVVPILGCLFLGIFLDKWLHSSPICLIIFLLLGIAAAFRNLFVMANNIMKK